MVRPTGDESKQVPIAEVKPGSWTNDSELSSKDDIVTLTKSQFQQILEAIGQTTVISGTEKRLNGHENAEYFPSKDVDENLIHSSEFRDEVQANVNISETLEGSSDKVQVSCPLDVIPCSASLNWSVSQAELSPSKSSLSKVEQKRLQWEKEKAEMIDWNPWGKPGAGAPPKRTQIVAPITPRTNNQLLMVHTSGAMPFSSSVPSSVPSCLPSPNCRIVPNSIDHNLFPPSKNFVNYSCVAQPVKPVPPVFKSSIAFGNPDSESMSAEYFKRQQWLREIDYQSEEQRRYQDQLQIPQIHDTNWVNKEETESISISIDGSILPGATEAAKQNYVRGQGFQLDPVSAAIAEERRIKAQEYQQAIRLQMEEKQNRLQAERERKKQEEEAEERRLEMERSRIQAEYEEEQLRIKQKAEMEEKKHQALVSAVQQAQAQAEMEKKSRKIHKLLPMNTESPEISNGKINEELMDITVLSNTLESQLKIDKNTEDSNMAKLKFSSRKGEKEDTIVEESDDSSDKKELGIQTVPLANGDKGSLYVVDRVLTPSIFRVRARGGNGKDFGTQTDIHYGKYSAEDAESTESNTSSFHSPVAKRLVRLQHSKPYKAQRRPLINDNVPVTDRPKWGVNQPSKSYIRMTDRDPHFSKRKKMQELRKQHWARELAIQKPNGSIRQPMIASYPNLRGRRLASSSDCTLGYSSSEFETRSHRPFRSNSTPRYHQPSGFRSDCGSAETIACFSYSPAHTSHFSQSYIHRRDSQSSDNLPSIIGGSEPSPTRYAERLSVQSCGGGSLPPMRRKWHSQETFRPSNNYHVFSPPHVPGVYPRMLCEPFHFNLPPPVPQRRKWSDQESFDLESVVRSRAVEGSRASSAESSEKSEAASISSAASSKAKSPVAQNPLVCPEVITGRPTPRQDRILQNLSSLRQGLLKKQKELESLIRRPPPYYS